MIEYQCEAGHRFGHAEGLPKLTKCQHFVGGAPCKSPISTGHYTAKLGEWKPDAK